MNFDQIFSQYYTQYRAEATPPSSSDDEYTIGMSFANDAIRRWASYDDVMWNELHTDSVTNSTGGVVLTTAGTSSYAAPTAMAKPGGYVRVLNASGDVQKHVPVVNPEDPQFLSQNSTGAYFLGNPNSGYTLRFIKAPDITGQTILYDYYKTPTLMTSGASKPDMSNPDFIVKHMLAERFMASRNPYYGTAKRDAENMLAQMKMQNDSGSISNPWTVPDRSGTSWGDDRANRWSW